MKWTHKFGIALVVILFSTPLVSAQNLSSYRKFALGSNLAVISKQVGQDVHESTMITERPAVIQELKYWPINDAYSTVQAEPAIQIAFDFLNGELYRINVTYSQEATEGLTEDDMVQSISARYGTARRLYPEISLPTNDVIAWNEVAVARWQDPLNAVTLLRSGDQNSFRLAVISKVQDGQADAAIAESTRLDKEQAPQKELDREKKEANDLEAARQKNQKTFRP